MAKKYDISSSSDMRRLSRDLKNSVMNAARNAVETMEFDVACPHCDFVSSMHSGLNLCPHCKNEVNVKLNTNF